MTNRELNQLFYLRREKTMWERRLKALSDIKSPALDVSAHGSSLSNPVADLVEQREKIQEIILQKEKEIIQQEILITEYITEIEDSYMRIIMYKRHIELKSWTAIAMFIGGNNTGDSIRKAHNRFLQKK